MSREKITFDRKIKLFEQISPIVEEFRTRYLDSEPIKDTTETLEQLGFLIVKFPAPEKLSGFHLRKSNCDCLFINSNHTLGRQNFSAWHEVYHAYTGDVGGISYMGEAEYSEMEQKADIFATNILMPAALVEEYIQKLNLYELTYITNVQIIRMQNHFQVSYSALLTRLCFLYPKYSDVLNRRRGLGTLKRKNDMRKKISEAGMPLKLTEASNDFYVSSTFYKSIYENLERDRITADKAQSIFEMIEGVKDRYSKRN